MTKKAKLQKGISHLASCKWLIGLLVTIACSTLYAALVSFKTMPISEGWYTEYAWLINHGQLPYRDFEYLFFPLYLFLISGFTKIFGYSIFALRILGIVVFAGMGAVLYCIFAKLFDCFSATIGAITTVLFIQSENAQVFYDYIRFHDLFTFICTYFFLKISCQCFYKTDISQEKYLAFSGVLSYFFLPVFYLIIGLLGEIAHPITSHAVSGSVFLIFICFGIYMFVKNFCWYRRGRKVSEHNVPLNAILCGIFASAECMVKQSNGTLMIILIAIFLLYCAFVLKKHSFINALYGYVFGIMLAFGGLIAYLLSSGTLSDFGRCCFSNALNAKGGLVNTLFRWIIPELKVAITGPNIIIVLLMIYIGVIFYSQSVESKRIKYESIKVFILGLILAVCSVLFVFSNQLSSQGSARYNTKIPEYVFFPCAALFAVYALYLLFCRIFKRTPGEVWEKLFPMFAILGVVFAQGYGVGLSGGLGASQVAIAVGFIAGFCIHAAIISGAKAMLCCLLVTTIAANCTFISRKTVQAYYWWGLVQDNINEHTEEVNVPLLNGIKVRPLDKYLYETVYHDVVDNTEKRDQIFVFPHSPIFYTITDRHSITYSKVQWFDVSSEDSINRDIETLRNNVPQMIVYVQIPEAAYEAHEMLFSAYQTRTMRDFLVNELIPS